MFKEFIENDFYKNRKGDIVKVIYITDMEVLYPIEVQNIKTSSIYKVTESAEYNHLKPDELDLVKHLPKNKHPELYL